MAHTISRVEDHPVVVDDQVVGPGPLAEIEPGELAALAIQVGCIVTSLAHEYVPFAWGVYRPSLIEMGVMVGSFAWFGFWFLLFTRLLPPVAIAELKEVLPLPLRGKKKEGGEG